MSNNQGLTLNKMRKERETPQSIYIQFVNSRKSYKTHVFCFYGGEDDKYYVPRIEQKFKNSIVTYKVGNKKDVLKLLDKITITDLYQDVCVLFFVNRNYENKKDNNKKELYITPCYSIENLYVHHLCLGRILQTEFDLDDKDRFYIMQVFEERLTEFNNYILEFNALMYLGRKKNKNYSFSSIQTFRILNVEVSKVSKSAHYNEIINRIRDKLNISDIEIEEAKKELINKGNYTMNFRGKNQLDFFVEFIKDVKRLIDKGVFSSIKQKGKYINSLQDPLNELSQYAFTPDDLDQFLETQKQKFFNNK